MKGVWVSNTAEEEGGGRSQPGQRNVREPNMDIPGF